jgi:hypothetical protein
MFIIKSIISKGFLVNNFHGQNKKAAPMRLKKQKREHNAA